MDAKQTKQTRRVKINGRKWVVGMEWSKSNDEKDEKANRIGSSGVLYTSWGSQFGFVNLSQTRAKEMLNNPCVSAFMRIPLNSFLGCFTFIDEDTNEQFFWVFSRNAAGRNLGGLSDACYDNETLAMDAFSTLKSLQTTNFDTVFVGGSVEDSLEYIEGLLPYSFIDGLRGTATLRPISKLGHEKKNQVQGFLKVIGFTFLAVWTAYIVYGKWQEHEAIQASKDTRARRAEYNRQFEAKPELLFNSKWNDAPLPDTAILACFAAINDLPLSVSGWGFKSATCSGSGGKIVAQYDYMPGAEILGLPSTAVLNDKTGREVSFSLPLPLSPVRSEQKQYRDLLKSSEISKLYFFLAQKLGAKISPFPPKFAPPETKQVQDVGQVTCPWTFSSWEISQMGPLTILSSAEILSKFPGLTVEAVKFDGNTWSIKGELYVQ